MIQNSLNMLNIQSMIDFIMIISKNIEQVRAGPWIKQEFSLIHLVVIEAT